MAKRKTWVWVLVIGFSVCVVAMLAMAGAAVFFVSSHIDARPTSTSNAFRQFDTTRAVFKDQRPLFELDQRERPRQTRELASLPTAAVKPHDLYILAWDPKEGPSDGRLIKISLPFWLLRMGRRKIDVFDRGGGFDFERLNLDIAELERVGPMLVVDYQTPRGERVLVWTQ